MSDTAYVNIHGEPMATSARDAVRVIYPDAQAKKADLLSDDLWMVRKGERKFSPILGTGTTKRPRGVTLGAAC